MWDYQHNVAMEQMPSQVNSDAFARCNEGVAAGFGPMFFNTTNPNEVRVNTPVKQGPRWHAFVLVGSLVFYTMAAVAWVGLNRFLTLTNSLIIFCVGYVFYLILSGCCSQIRAYIMNLRRFDEYQAIFDLMVNGKGYFTFWIQCYHYVTVRTKNGTSRQKRVTHTATEVFRPVESIDESGKLEGIQDINRYVFIDYMKRFNFTDSLSEQLFQKAFNAFVAKNTRDMYQNYTHTFEIENYQDKVGFSALGPGAHNTVLFFLFTFLGLAPFYSFVIERGVSRYEIGLLKRLTVR